MNSELWKRDSKFCNGCPLPSIEVLLEVGASRGEKGSLLGAKGFGNLFLSCRVDGRGRNRCHRIGWVPNGFDPYMVSSFARKTLISSAGRLLQKIRIAGLFLYLQMATSLRGLAILLHREGRMLRRDPFPLLSKACLPGKKKEGRKRARWESFLDRSHLLDEDVPEREIGPLLKDPAKKWRGWPKGSPPPVPVLCLLAEPFREKR